MEISSIHFLCVLVCSMMSSGFLSSLLIKSLSLLSFHLFVFFCLFRLLSLRKIALRTFSNDDSSQYRKTRVFYRRNMLDVQVILLDITSHIACIKSLETSFSLVLTLSFVLMIISDVSSDIFFLFSAFTFYFSGDVVRLIIICLKIYVKQIFDYQTNCVNLETATIYRHIFFELFFPRLAFILAADAVPILMNTN